jgi:hypothetical protein
VLSKIINSGWREGGRGRERESGAGCDALLLVDVPKIPT